MTLERFDFERLPALNRTPVNDLAAGRCLAGFAEGSISQEDGAVMNRPTKVSALRAGALAQAARGVYHSMPDG